MNPKFHGFLLVGTNSLGIVVACQHFLRFVPVQPAFGSDLLQHLRVAQFQISGKVGIEKLRDDFRFPLLLSVLGKPQGVKGIGVAGRGVADIREKIKLIKLPPYSPDLNPIEQCWRITRREVTHNTYFPDALVLESAVDGYFEQYREPNEKFASLCSFKYKN